MASFDTRTPTQAAGVQPVSQPVQSAQPFNNVGAALGVAQTGLSLFATNQKNLNQEAIQSANELKQQQEMDASRVAATYISEVEQVRAMKGGIAAQTFAAQKFAELQGSLNVGTREMFVDHVKKGLGFNPIQASTNRLIEQEEAQQAQNAIDRDTATSIYMASVDLNNPEAVQTAASNVQNMSNEQIDFLLQVNKAEDIKVEKEMQRHNLVQERAATADVKRASAQRLATTAVNAGFRKLASGFQIRLEQAISSGDSARIQEVQKEGLASLTRIEAGLQGDVITILQSQGVQDADLTTVNAQLQPLKNQIANLRNMFQLNDLQTATTNQVKYQILTSLNQTARQDTQLGRVATNVLSDVVFGTRFGQTYVEKYATSDLLHSALSFNNIEQDDEKAMVKKMEDAVTQGSVFAVQELDPATPRLSEITADLTQAQVTALQVGVDKPEVRNQLASGVVQNWEAAAFGNSTNAIRSKVFEPTLNFFSDAKNATAYKGELAGTEDTFLAASMEYVKGNVMPALTQAIGLSSQDLSTQFEVEVQDGKFRLMPKVVGGQFAEQSPAGQAAAQATSRRRVVAQAARKTEALYNKILLTYSNLYDVNLNTAMEVFAERYATSLGVDLVRMEEENVNTETE